MRRLLPLALLVLAGCDSSAGGGDNTAGASLKPDELAKKRAAVMVDDGMKGPATASDGPGKR